MTHRRAPRLRSLLAASLVAPMLIPLAASPALATHSDRDGSVSGFVTDIDGQPLGNVCVAAFDADGNRADLGENGNSGPGGPEAASSLTRQEGAGYYFMKGLASGSYKLRFRDCGRNVDPVLGFDNRNLTTQWVAEDGVGERSFALSRSVTISATEARSHDELDEGDFGDHTVDVVMSADPGTLSGSIQEDTTGLSLPGTCIQLIETETGSVVVETASVGGNTNTAGQYSFRGLPNTDSGEFKYKVQFRDDIANCGSLDRAWGTHPLDHLGASRNEPTASDINTHQGEYYDNKTSIVDAAELQIPAGGSATQINASLAKVDTTRGVSGTVRDQAGAAANNVCVTAYPSAGGSGVGNATTTSTGTYSLPLPAGTYVLEFHERCSSATAPSDDRYVAEFWQDVTYADGDAPTSANPTLSSFKIIGTPTNVTVNATGFTTVSPTIDKRGSISGTVTSSPSSGSTPLQGICVAAVDGQNAMTNPPPYALTDGSGLYKISGVRPGSAPLVHFNGTECPNTAANGLYMAEYWQNSATKAGATTVSVTAGNDTPAISATLEDSATGTISGMVTRESDGAAASGVCVRVLNADGIAVGSTSTAQPPSTTPDPDPNAPPPPAAGTYTVTVPVGTYKVEFSRPVDGCGLARTQTGQPATPLTPSASNYYATEYHTSSTSPADDAALQVEGSDVPVTANNVTTANESVERGARLSGTITGSSEAICVELTRTDNTVIRSTMTTGSYTFPGLLPATYLVRADDRDPSGTCGGAAFSDQTDNFQTEWFNDKRSSGAADRLTLAAEDDTTGINVKMDPFALPGGAFVSLSGYVQDGTGSPVNGVKVELFRFDQDPGVDKPVFSTTTADRSIAMAQRQCAPDPITGRPVEYCEGTDGPYQIVSYDDRAGGYWEISDATQPGGPDALTAGIYKVRFTDPTGLRATEWYRSRGSFDDATGVQLREGATVELGDRAADVDRYDADLTDDNPDDPFEFLSNDPGDNIDPDTHPECRYERRDGCLFDSLPPSDNPSELIVDLAQAGSVTGRATNEATSAAVQGVRVDLLDAESGSIVATAFTNANGEYRLLGAAAGAYKVHFTPSDPKLGDEYYDNVRTFGAAKVIPVNAGTTTSAVNATLPPNTAPRAGDDSVQAEVNETTTLGNLLGNDTDAEGDALTIVSVTQGTPHGTVVLNEDGVSVDFTPAEDSQEPTTFTYTIEDESGLSDTATVSVEMVGVIVGSPPVARDDEAATPTSTAVTVSVLANDDDPDGDNSEMTVVSITEPFHGTASIVGKQVRYSPEADFVGVDQFSYTVRDAQGFTSSARVTVSVGSPNESATNESVAAGGTAATEGTNATPDNPIITSVTSPNAGTIRIVESETNGGNAGDVALVKWRVDITAPNATASNPLVITFRLDGTLLQGEQPHRAIRVLRNLALVRNCLGSTVANPDPCLSGHRMIGDDVLLTIRTSQASAWNFGFDNDAVVDRATGATGTGRVGTAVDVSKNAFSPAEVDTVLIARQDAYPDALAGAPLAHQLGAPLLLTSTDSLEAITQAEIERLGVSRVIILGGTSAVSTTVENQLRAIAGVQSVERIRGANRFETAARIADQLTGYDTAYVVEGADANASRGWPDAVSVASLAAYEGRPILLVTTEALPAETRAALSGLKEAVVIGGTASVSTAVVQEIDKVVGVVGRVRGTDRYETSFAVAQRARAAGMSVSSVWLATGLNFPDALAAGPAVAREGGILLLVNGKDYAASPAVKRFLDANSANIEVVTLTGGTAAISVGTEAAVRQDTTN